MNKEIDKAIENMKSHVKAYENNLRSISTVNSINKDWDGKAAMEQPISIDDKRYTYTVESLESCKLAISALEAQKDDGWIPVSSGRLPEEKINPFTGDYCEYECTADFGEAGIDIRYYKFGRGCWYENGDCLDKYVTAWKDRPEPYDPLAEKIQRVLDREYDRISGKK